MIPLRWVGPIFDTSGYASATRGYLSALIDSGKVDLSISAVSFERQKVGQGAVMEKIKPFYDKPVNNKIQVTHLTPENYPTVRTTGKYNVAYTAWETDRLPDNWVSLCNSMDEIWTPSTWNQEVFKNSGVEKPIYVVPHVVQVPDISQVEPVSMGVDDDVFVFYSVFQWIERKNPIGLLKAYLTEFRPKEKVCLALKSYRIDTSGKEQQAIKADIQRLKKALALHEFPPVRFFGTLLTAEQMQGFHRRGDCFVLPHKGEGFGIPHAEAMALGKPVIATSYSGNMEFMNKKNSYLVDYHESPVCNMIFPNYHGHMTWAEPSVMHLRQQMRKVFKNPSAAKERGAKAALDIKEQLSAARIASIITERLEEIQKGLS